MSVLVAVLAISLALLFVGKTNQESCTDFTRQTAKYVQKTSGFVSKTDSIMNKLEKGEGACTSNLGIGASKDRPEQQLEYYHLKAFADYRSGNLEAAKADADKALQISKSLPSETLHRESVKNMIRDFNRIIKDYENANKP